MLFGDNRGKSGIMGEYNIYANRGFQSIELFQKSYDSIKYDSFILGNSRSFFYDVNTWKKYITGEPFHLNTSSESIYGIERKLDFLNNKNVQIKNVIVALDCNTLGLTTDRKGYLFVKHPVLTNNYFHFYKTMFEGFFPKSMYAHTELFITKKRKEYMGVFGIYKNTWKLEKHANQLTWFYYDSIIENNSELHYKDAGFYEREPTQLYSNKIIGEKQKELLSNMKSIFNTQNTNYKIIINPLYDQQKFNEQDLKYLKDLFGDDNVHDFSGINEYTKTKYNYYETSHYRPHIAASIMNKIYSK